MSQFDTFSEGWGQPYGNLSPRNEERRQVVKQEWLQDETMPLPIKAALWHHQGWVLADQAQWDAAIACFNEALAHDPDHYPAWCDRAVAQSNLGQYEAAVEDCDRAMALCPEAHTAWNQRGIAQHHLGRYEDAVASYDRALSGAPDFSLAWFNRGLSLEKLHRLREALNSYDRVLQIAPEHQSAWHHRGHLLHQLNLYEGAIFSYDRVLALDPENAYAWAHRGKSLQAMGQLEAALSSYDTALQRLSGAGSIWRDRGAVLLMLKRYAESVRSLERSLELDPTDELAQTLKATVGAKLHRQATPLSRSDRPRQDLLRQNKRRWPQDWQTYETVVEQCQEALELNPTDLNLWSRQAIALTKLWRYEAAIASYDKAIELDSENAELWYQRGLVWRRLGRFEEAIANFDQALVLNPTLYTATYSRLYTLLTTGWLLSHVLGHCTPAERRRLWLDCRNLCHAAIGQKFPTAVIVGLSVLFATHSYGGALSIAAIVLTIALWGDLIHEAEK